MAKNSILNNWFFKIFLWLVFLTLLAPLLFTKELLYPFIATKALFIRTVVVLVLPFYAYLLVVDKNNRPNLKNPVTLGLVAYLLLSLVSTFVGVNWIRAFWGNYERMDGMYQTLHLGLLYFYLLYLFRVNSEYTRKFLYGVIIVSVITSVYGLLELVGFRFFEDASFPRVSSTFGNPIFFASFLIIPIFLSGFFALQEDSRNWSRFLWFSLVVQSIAVFASQTRGAILGLILGSVVLGSGYFIFSSNKKIRTRGIIGLTAFILIIGALFFIGRNDSTGGIARVFNLNDSNAKARLIQWKSGLLGFKDAPILGVGPENYNVVANKYFNPEIYKYDSTWFDKPHNYFLEVLITRGLAGFLAYLGLIFFTTLAFWKAYKQGFFTWIEFCLLISAVIAYQVQNLFAFDTIAASWVFFAFTAFAGFLWDESSIKASAENKIIGSINNIFGYAIFGVLVVFGCYLIFVTDWTTSKVLYNLNIGYAVGLNDPQTAVKYFEQAKSESFIYDLGDLGMKYGEFAVALGQDQNTSQDHTFINQVLDNATEVLEKTTLKITNNPIYWYHLANDYDTKSIVNKTPVDQKAKIAVQNAINLAPNRVEPKFFLVQIYGLEKDIPNVVKLSEQIAKEVPFFPEAKWRLALAYKDNNQLADAVREAGEAMADGYKFKLVQEFKWLINYYADQQNYPKVAELYEDAVKISPNDYQLYASLATVYSKIGDKDKALQAAQKVLELNPASKPTVDAFIKSLQ